MKDICGRRPLHGSGDVWCVLPPRHVGIHEGDDGESFIRVEPGVRVNAEGYLVASERRTGSRRLTPQVGKAGALPPAGRRRARDRRSFPSADEISVGNGFSQAEIRTLIAITDEWCGASTLDTRTARSALRKLRKMLPRDHPLRVVK